MLQASSVRLGSRIGLSLLARVKAYRPVLSLTQPAVTVATPQLGQAQAVIATQTAMPVSSRFVQVAQLEAAALRRTNKTNPTLLAEGTNKRKKKVLKKHRKKAGKTVNMRR